MFRARYLNDSTDKVPAIYTMLRDSDLGLNYVRAIVDAHKGEITVISEPGKGSRFEIFLPFNSDN